MKIKILIKVEGKYICKFDNELSIEKVNLMIACGTIRMDYINGKKNGYTIVSSIYDFDEDKMIIIVEDI